MARPLILPRLLWVNRQMSLKELHLQVFKHLRTCLAEWCEWTQPDTPRRPAKDSYDLRQLPDFPYRLPDSDAPLTREQFDALSDEEAFEMCFKGVLAGECDDQHQSTGAFDIERMPYELNFSNPRSMYETCKICSKMQCKHCLVPYVERPLKEALTRYGLERNNTLFNTYEMNRNKEVVVQASWHPSLVRNLFDFMAQARPMERALPPKTKEGDEPKLFTPRSSNVQLEQCLNEFKQVETLDEDNKWYCNKCKDFVQADKTLEIYRIPRVLIISLKRFKTSKNRYGFGGGQKLDTLVDFPLTGLDMKPFVLSPEQRGRE